MTSVPLDRWRDAVGSALRDASAVVFPVSCEGCGASDRRLCSSCRAALAPSCTVRALDDSIEVHSALVYRGVARSVIASFKESAPSALAPALGAAMRDSFATAAALHGGDIVICPVPPSMASRRRRGFDPLAILLAAAGLGRVPQVLSVRGHRGEQKRLSAAERASNVAGTMVATRALTGRRLIIVDDIITSGSTLAEAVRACQDAGGEVLAAATLAATPRNAWAAV